MFSAGHSGWGREVFSSCEGGAVEDRAEGEVMAIGGGMADCERSSARERVQGLWRSISFLMLRPGRKGRAWSSVKRGGHVPGGAEKKRVENA